MLGYFIKVNLAMANGKDKEFYYSKMETSTQASFKMEKQKEQEHSVAKNRKSQEHGKMETNNEYYKVNLK